MNGNHDMNRRGFMKSGLAAVAMASGGMQLVMTPSAKAAGKVVI